MRIGFCVVLPILVHAKPFKLPFVSHGGATKEVSGVSLPLGSAPLDVDREAPLMKDLELLSQILSDIVETENPRVHNLYEDFRRWGLERSAADVGHKEDGSNLEALQKMIQAAELLTPSEALGVTRTFSVMLNLVNAAEVHHRRRMIRQYKPAPGEDAGGPLPLIQDGVRGTFQSLLKEGYTPEQIIDQLATQKVELVLTAHPTQVQRKSLLRKYRQVTELLSDLERSDLDDYESMAARKDLTRVISSVWGADEIRRLKPTPQKEAAGGNAVIESVLWDAVPAYLRKLDQQCQLSLNMTLPVDVCPIKFASWIGGDRDGNPNVTPEVTIEVVLHQRLRAARLFLRDLYDLLGDLAISSRFTDRMLELAATVEDSPHEREKYRRVIGHLIQRLSRTVHQLEGELRLIEKDAIKPTLTLEDDSDVEPITEVEELLGPLMIMHESLVETGFNLVADGLLIDIIRRCFVFGLSLAPLDIREESTRHTEALDAITRWLGIGSYKEWSEDARLSWLASELASKRPLFRAFDRESMGFDDTVESTLRTFEAAASLHPATLGAYVISQAQTASDVLAVMLLQKQYGMTSANGNMMRIVPLFETLDDLNNAPERLETLFSIPLYMGAVEGKQEVMVGYSDSAKDAGRLAACWAQYISQERMAEVAKKRNVELTFFHGKGGTVGRGGNPSAYRSILSHPPNTINGRFRVTVQGEMIQQNFGAPSMAERSMDIYIAGVCREHFTKHVEPSDEWRAQMQKISDASCEEYRHLVREEPRFVPYFRQATPELELGSLNIGSRPAKRKPKGGIESLRAIPWTFAWTQTRTHLSAWLGVGAGLSHENSDELAILREMYKNWPWFRETIDLVSMIVAKTDFSICKNYDDKLVEKKTGLDKLGEEVRELLVKTRRGILDVTETEEVSGAHINLMRASSAIRHPYVDPVNVIQAELLKRLRTLENKKRLSTEEEEQIDLLKDALVLSINAIAQGMRNSG